MVLRGAFDGIPRKVELTYPDNFKGASITPMSGQSLAPTFAGDMIDRDTLYFEHEGNRAIRQGKWKLVAKGAKGSWELYDMEADRTEMNNLADSSTELAGQLARVPFPQPRTEEL